MENTHNAIAQSYGWKIENGGLYNRNGVMIAALQVKNNRLRFMSRDGQKILGSMPESELSSFDRACREKFYGQKLVKP